MVAQLRAQAMKRLGLLVFSNRTSFHGSLASSDGARTFIGASAPGGVGPFALDLCSPRGDAATVVKAFCAHVHLPLSLCSALAACVGAATRTEHTTPRAQVGTRCWHARWQPGVGGGHSSGGRRSSNDDDGYGGSSSGGGAVPPADWDVCAKFSTTRATILEAWGSAWQWAKRAWRLKGPTRRASKGRGRC
jgi:uncharacterized membrane protein YgcG